MKTRLTCVAALVALCASLPLLQSARAGTLTLTAAGTADGFTLSNFADLNPSLVNTFSYGPFGVAYAGGGKVVVSNYATNAIYSFANSDGQTSSSALNTITGAGTGVVGMASLNGVAYGEDHNTGVFAAYNSDGTINHDLTGVTAYTYLGMAGDPQRGTIIATTSSQGLIEIDPTANGGTGSYRVIAKLYPDGVSISPDGSTVYIDNGGTLDGIDIATGNVTYSGPYISGLDGTGVIASTNSLNGDIIANTNGGLVDLVDPTTSTITTIANNGSRGDYTSADPTTGTLFLDYSDSVYRLSCGPNCSIGGGPPPIHAPEPGSLALLGIALLGLGAARYRLKR